MSEEPNLSDELKKMQYEPLLPIEKKLILISIISGVILLFLLVIISHEFFPTAHTLP